MKELLPYWPQITVLVISVLTLLKHFLFSGQTRIIELKPVTAVLMLIGYVYILVLGGFFDKWNAPQIIYTILTSLVFLLLLFILFFFGKFKNKLKDGGKVKHTISGITWYDFVGLFLLWWGDFFDGYFQYLMK